MASNVENDFSVHCNQFLLYFPLECLKTNLGSFKWQNLKACKQAGPNLTLGQGECVTLMHNKAAPPYFT